jgi:hypothetical protein
MTQLLLLHGIGNAALLVLAYYWLGVGESDAAHLLLSAMLIVTVAAGFAWLHGVSLAHFRSAGALRTARVVPLMLLSLIIAIVYFAADYWNPASESRINQTASYLTMTFQTPVRPASVERVFHAIWWAVEWIILPVLLLPAASGIAARGWAGFAEFGAKRKTWSYWLLVPVLLLVAIWTPFQLMKWTPRMSGFAMEMASLIARFGAAYLLFVAGGLLLAFVTSRGRPIESQPTTSVSP